MDTDVYPRSADQIESWDLEADVVIAGYGIAGAAAAVEAASAGADVLVSSAPEGGAGRPPWRADSSTSAAGHRIQKACGFDDSVDNMAAFLNVAMGPGADANRSRRLLRRQRRSFRLAGAVRRAVQAGVLGRARLGAARATRA